MKRLFILFVTFFLIGSVNADTNGTVTTTSPAVTTASPTESTLVGDPTTTTGSMDATKPTPGAVAGVDATGKTQPNESSSGFTNNVRIYWNKFIDVFSGPSSRGR